jgi:hypothetical protein
MSHGATTLPSLPALDVRMTAASSDPSMSHTQCRSQRDPSFAVGPRDAKYIIACESRTVRPTREPLRQRVGTSSDHPAETRPDPTPHGIEGSGAVRASAPPSDGRNSRAVRRGTLTHSTRKILHDDPDATQQHQVAPRGRWEAKRGTIGSTTQRPNTR